MQAKKRAKPVIFGKKKEQANIVHEHHSAPVHKTTQEPTSPPVHHVVAPDYNQQHHQQNINEPIIQAGNIPAAQQEYVNPNQAQANITNDTNPEGLTEVKIEEVQIPYDEPVHTIPPPQQAETFTHHNQIHNQEAPNLALNIHPPQINEELNRENSPLITAAPEDQLENATPDLGGDTYIVEKKVQKSVIGYFILIAVISFVVGLASMAGANFFMQNSNIAKGLPFLATKPTAAPKVKPTIQPSATPEPIDLAEYSIKILNGSGITGAATKLKQNLNNNGFNVISIGNADNNEYTDTIINSGKKVKAGYITKLEEELGKLYPVSTKTSTSSAASDDADLVIILGSKTASQVSPEK